MSHRCEPITLHGEMKSAKSLFQRTFDHITQTIGAKHNLITNSFPDCVQFAVKLVRISIIKCVIGLTHVLSREFHRGAAVYRGKRIVSPQDDELVHRQHLVPLPNRLNCHHHPEDAAVHKSKKERE